LNWTCQRPAHHHKDRDDKVIARWVKEVFPQILRSARARGAHLCFIDETGFQLEPTVRRTYAPRGQARKKLEEMRGVPGLRAALADKQRAVATAKAHLTDHENKLKEMRTSLNQAEEKVRKCDAELAKLEAQMAVMHRLNGSQP
jgi:hypothetical protein